MHTRLFAAAAMTAALSLGHAYAGPVTDTFCGPSAGTGCEAGTLAKVFLQSAKGVTSGLGNVGSQKSPIILDLTSDGGLLNILIDLSNGFATITPAKPAGTFNGIDVSVPGFEITELVFDVQLTPISKNNSTTRSFTVEGFTGGSSDGIGTLTDKPDQDAEYSITALGGGFDHVNIKALGGFDEIKHLELTLCQVTDAGACGTVVIPTPEPASLAVLGFGLLGLVGIRSRR